MTDDQERRILDAIRAQAHAAADRAALRLFWMLLGTAAFTFLMLRILGVRP